jgi:hypothetical protein
MEIKKNIKNCNKEGINIQENEEKKRIKSRILRIMQSC